MRRSRISWTSLVAGPRRCGRYVYPLRYQCTNHPARTPGDSTQCLIDCGTGLGIVDCWHALKGALSLQPFVFPSVRPSVRLSFRPSVRLSVRPFFRSSVLPWVRPFGVTFPSVSSFVHSFFRPPAYYHIRILGQFFESKS